MPFFQPDVMADMTTQQQSEWLLEMIDVSKSFPGVKALDNVNLRVRPHSVHALMGENGAGKSTLLKCLFGIYEKDQGKIFFKGQEINFTSSKEALENGVSMVHQELNLVLQRTVMDNMWLGRYPTKGWFIDHGKMYDDTKRIFDELDIDIDPKVKVATLSVSQMQMIEIAKAFSYDAKIVIMDEPTSSLTEKEVNHLFKIINKLKDKGCGIVYISHKMEEIFQLCDEITILRDGQWVATQPLKGMSMDQIIGMMVGRELTQRFPEKTNQPKEVILEIEHLTAKNQPSIQDVTFNLHKGEILGIAGLVGAKRTDIVETLFGIRDRSQGSIKLHGKEVANHNAHEAIRNGFALVTEERRSTGIYSRLDIAFNSLIANMDSYKGSMGLLSDNKMKSDTQWVIDSMRVKTPTQQTQIGSLSGGNQQKVIIGRWLLTQPEILMLDEPTRGIDVGAKFEIYQLILELAKKDKGIIIISSEMPELLGITDRIMVMSNGRVAGIVNTKETDQSEILRLASLYL
ncbi:Galactose/methyl galactoside import ATP-binding protein MglA [Aeromonas veronii]